AYQAELLDDRRFEVQSRGARVHNGLNFYLSRPALRQLESLKNQVAVVGQLNSGDDFAHGSTVSSGKCCGKRCLLWLRDRGRDAGCPAPPAQIPAGGFSAPGSSPSLAHAR